ncbi:MAG TPA: tetratricopeptide repeat protein [Ktedonobacterales bacterium]
MAGAGADPPTGDPDHGAAVSDWLRRPLRAYKWLVIALVVVLVAGVILVPFGMVLVYYPNAMRTVVGAALAFIRSDTTLALALAGALALLLLLSVAGEMEYRRRVHTLAVAARRALAAARSPAPVAPALAAAAPAEAPRAPAVRLPAADDRPAAVTRTLAAAGRQSTHDAPATPEGIVARAGLPQPEMLVGRESLVAEVVQLLRAGSAVALVARDGQPGIGKSALAAAVAARLAREGVVWVACDGLRGAEGGAALWARVARALDLAWVAEVPDLEVRRATLRAAVADAGRRTGVLALDNVEPELDIEAVLDTLGGGRMKLLLSARELVESPRVRAIEVGALVVEAAQQLLEQQVSRFHGAGASADDAGTLAALPPFLDGWPLAIRLAAPAVAARQGPGTDLVRAFQAAHTAAEPRARLHSHVARAWQLATSQEQALLAGLALLAGETFPRAAALAIALATAEDVTEAHASEALDVLIGLALVETRACERLWLHPVIRQSAIERLSALDSALTDRMGLAMVTYWLESAASHLQTEMVEALDAESAGLLGAIGWAHGHAHQREVLLLVHALIPFWRASERPDEAGRALPWGLEAARALGDERETQFMQHEVALNLSQTGQVDEARTAFEAALALARARSSQRDELNELSGLAELESGARSWKPAREHFTAALGIAHTLGDRREQRKLLHGLARLETETSQLIAAKERYEQALEIATLLADRRAQRDELQGLAGVELGVGQSEQAQRDYVTALELARALADPWAIRETLHGLAQLQQRLGHFNGAQTNLEEALLLARQLGDLALQSVEQRGLGSLDLDTGEMDKARGHFQEALTLARQANQPALIADALSSVAVLEERLGNLPAARDGFRAALEIYERLGSPEAKATRLRLKRLGPE